MKDPHPLHFHTVIPEGVWQEQPDGTVAFHALPPPTDEDITVLTVRIVRRVARLLARRDYRAGSHSGRCRSRRRTARRR